MPLTPLSNAVRTVSAVSADVLYTGPLMDELQALGRAARYHDWLFDLARPHLGSRVLEIGAGIGTMTDRVLDREAVFALEYDPTFGARLREKYSKNGNVKVLVGDVLDRDFLASNLTDAVDSAMSFNVFEHIEDDVAALRNVAELLPQGGRAVLFVPAFPALYGRADAHIGHFRRYRRPDLIGTARRAGLRPISCHYVNLPGFFAWFANARVLRSQRAIGSAAALRAYDRFVIPPTRLLEDRVRPPFGQSLLLVAERS